MAHSIRRQEAMVGRLRLKGGRRLEMNPGQTLRREPASYLLSK